MTRVSEGSSHASMQFALNKAKAKMEDLQLKGATLKSMVRPSDDPVSNLEAMQLSSITDDNRQYMRNSEFAMMQLNVTEKSLENLTDILTKAKEIAIGQSSDLYNEDVRKNIANEVNQLRNLALSIANKRIGQKYIFGGFKTLETPFDKDGNYFGDEGHTTLEVSKDFFVATNLHGAEIFFTDKGFDTASEHPLNKFPEMESSPQNIKLKTDKLNADKGRELASENDISSNEVKDSNRFEKRENIFSLLETLSNALENNEPQVIQNSLERFDSAISRLITLRTRVGSIAGSVMNSQTTIESDNIDNATRRSKIVDADIAELFTDITKQQNILQTTYKSSQGLMNKNLLDFLR